MKQPLTRVFIAALLYLTGAMCLPAASLTVNPQVLPEGATVTITYVETSDAWPIPDAENFTFSWGDGATTRFTNSTIHRFDLLHVYADNGSGGVITITVNEDGDIMSDQISVTNVPPATDLPNEVNVGSGEALTNIVHITDPGADTFTATISYGDGSAPETLNLAANRVFALNHIYPTNGVYELAVTVADDDGGITPRRTAVIVGPRPGAQLSIFTLAGLIVQGVPGRSYDIQKRDQLEESGWTTVGMVTLTSETQAWIDYGSTNSPNRFYRAVER